MSNKHYTDFAGHSWYIRPGVAHTVYSPATGEYQETEADRSTMLLRYRMSSAHRWSTWKPIQVNDDTHRIFDALLGPIDPTTVVGVDGLDQWRNPKTGRVWDRGQEPGHVEIRTGTLRRIFRFTPGDHSQLEWRFPRRDDWRPAKSDKWVDEARDAILGIWWPSMSEVIGTITSDKNSGTELFVGQATTDTTVPQTPTPVQRTAASFLDAALGHMVDRAATYDRPQGERSMGNCVRAFNAITGQTMTEEQGWLFMALLKIVRTQQGKFRADNYEDLAAYAGLAGEAAARDKV